MIRRNRTVRHAEELLRKGGTHLVCSKCREEKELSEKNFYKDNNSIGYKTVCKCCKAEYYKQNREQKIEYQKQYIKENKDYFRAYQQIYRITKGKVEGLNIKVFRKTQRLQGLSIGA